jgi:hypothetical protein
VVGRAFERDASLRDSPQGVGQFRPCRVQDGDMGMRQSRRTAAAGLRRFPRVQSDVMVITPAARNTACDP